jgi:ubiquinone/menaquinone biosynthesis C-methylase UbiE
VAGLVRSESQATSPAEAPRMGYGEALDHLRADPRYADLIRDIYLGPDPVEEARRFERSAEWRETCRLLRGRIARARVVDLGAGAGIASYAFISAGAREVLAVEPWSGAAAGRDAVERLGLQGIVSINSMGEDMPIDTDSVDIVYARQTLHHAADLKRMLAEIARVLRPGGVVFTSRDHVVDDTRQLAQFLAGHPVHRLAGGEHAFTLDEYLDAIRSAGLRVERVITPWGSVINLFPWARSEADRQRLLRAPFERRLGAPGRLVARVPGATTLMRRRIESRRPPGRPYSFLGLKPGGSTRR